MFSSFSNSPYISKIMLQPIKFKDCNKPLHEYKLVNDLNVYSSQRKQIGNRFHYKAIMQQTKNLSLSTSVKMFVSMCVSFKARSQNVTTAFSTPAQPPLNPPVFEVGLSLRFPFREGNSDLLLHSTEITQMLITSFIFSLLSPTVDSIIGQTNNSLSTDYFANLLKCYCFFYWVDLIKAENVRQFLSTASFQELQIGYWCL